MFDTGSRTRLLLSLGAIFASICIIYRVVLFFAPIWASPVAIALTGCWIIFLMHRWQRVPADYSSEFADLAAMITIQPLREKVFLPFGQWAMEPASLLQIINYIQIHQCESVVECGSGLSTLIIGALFQQNQRGHIISLEEDPEWHEIMSNMLAEQGLNSYVTLISAPLQPYNSSGEETLWYSREHLAVIFQEFSHLDLLIIDGPIASSSASRYPALPEFEPLIDDQTLIILDDSNRPREQNILETWKQMYDLDIEFRNRSKRGQAYIHFRRGSSHNDE